MAMITISREVGSDGDQIARRVCELLGYRYFDKLLMAEVAREQGLADTEVVDFSEDNYRARRFIDALLKRSVPIATAGAWATTTRGEEVKLAETVDEPRAADFMAAAIRALRKRGRVVVVGRGGQAILRDQPDVLNVRIIARLEDRVQRVMQSRGLTRDAAQRSIIERDRATAEYLRRFHGIDWVDPMLYHMTLNTSLLDREAGAELIVAAARWLEARPEGQQLAPTS